MLSQKRIEGAVHTAMEQFSSENDGAEGWEMEALEREIAKAGGEEKDFLHAIRFGMETCGFKGIKRFHLKQGGDGRDALSLAEEVEHNLSVISLNTNSICRIALDTAARFPDAGAPYLYAIQALAGSISCWMSRSQTPAG